MEPKNHLKSLKKVIGNYFFFLLVPFGAQGVPGITFQWILAPFLLDFRMIFSRCGKLLFTYPRYIFYHALSLFATLSGPPCHYRYIYIYLRGKPPFGIALVTNFGHLGQRFGFILVPFCHLGSTLGITWATLTTHG